jgi:hypothetical protein
MGARQRQLMTFAPDRPTRTATTHARLEARSLTSVTETFTRNWLPGCRSRASVALIPYATV